MHNAGMAAPLMAPMTASVVAVAPVAPLAAQGGKGGGPNEGLLGSSAQDMIR